MLIVIVATISRAAGPIAIAIAPDPTLTPGAVRTTDVSDICGRGTRELRHWSRERDDRILHEYGLPAGAHPSYEIDHLIPLGIGGADEDLNCGPNRAAASRLNGMRNARINSNSRCAISSVRAGSR